MSVLKENEVEVIMTKDEKRWFDFIKERANKINYGGFGLEVIIKKNRIVAFKKIKELESFNIIDRD